MRNLSTDSILVHCLCHCGFAIYFNLSFWAERIKQTICHSKLQIISQNLGHSNTMRIRNIYFLINLIQLTVSCVRKKSFQMNIMYPHRPVFRATINKFFWYICCFIFQILLSKLNHRIFSWRWCNPAYNNLINGFWNIKFKLINRRIDWSY